MIMLLMLFVSAAALSYGLVLLVRPMLVRYAMAKPNVRSSHRTPTPQGGGIAVVISTLVTLALAVAAMPDLYSAAAQCWPLTIAALLLAALGWADDVWNLPVAPRLALHVVSVALVVIFLTDDLRIVPQLPLAVERALMLLAGVYLINIVNFMDGLDWMTVAEFVPVSAGIALAAGVAGMPPLVAVIAIALAGAVIGFAPFNRPTAKLFLGDVGSLPLGLVMFWMLLQVAGRDHLAAAVLLPLYYLMDASVTLLRRIARGEKIHEAHRCHFYQRAIDLGFSVSGIVAWVFAVNLVLVALAAWTLVQPSLLVQVTAVAFGIVLVTGLLRHFSQARC